MSKDNKNCIDYWESTLNRTLKFAFGNIEVALDSTEPLEYKFNRIEMSLSVIDKVRKIELKNKELQGD